jgi:hypothetical protein
MDIDRYRKIKRLADKTPFQGEKKVAEHALSKVKDPRLSRDQISTLLQLRDCGFKITYDIAEPEGTAKQERNQLQ